MSASLCGSRNAGLSPQKMVNHFTLPRLSKTVLNNCFKNYIDIFRYFRTANKLHGAVSDNEPVCDASSLRSLDGTENDALEMEPIYEEIEFV